jgi:hypothetical protein
MATPKGYSSYHGRMSPLKVLVTIVLVLVILGAVAFLALQQFLVYDETGTPHLQLPAGSTAESSAAPSGGATSSDQPLNIVIDKPENTPSTDLYAVQLGSDPAAWQSALSADWNGVCVTMRASGGVMQYYSTISGTVLSDAAAATSAALPALTDGKLHTIARISCLRDSTAALANVDAMGLKNTGNYIFYDGNNENWLDPSKPATVEYICGIAKECAGLGFQEILLTDVTYPTVGKIDKINYNGADQTQTLTALVRAVKAAVGESVSVTVELPMPVVLNGADTTAGLSLTEMSAAADGIYSQMPAEQLEQVPEALWTSGFVPEMTGETGKIAGHPLLLLPS